MRANSVNLFKISILTSANIQTTETTVMKKLHSCDGSIFKHQETYGTSQTDLFTFLYHPITTYTYLPIAETSAFSNKFYICTNNTQMAWVLSFLFTKETKFQYRCFSIIIKYNENVFPIQLSRTAHLIFLVPPWRGGNMLTCVTLRNGQRKEMTQIDDVATLAISINVLSPKMIFVLQKTNTTIIIAFDEIFPQRKDVHENTWHCTCTNNFRFRTKTTVCS